MKNPALAMKLAVALTLAACGPADAGNAPATVAAAGASGAQDLPMVAEVGFSDLLRDPATPFIGAENADIIIIGFMDYNCPYCKMMIPELEGLMKADPKVRILYKEWPIFGAVSDNVARLAMAANYQGKYHEVHKAFMGTKGRIETDQ
ncbi:DsbA family protein, partial [Brevundimonas sp.]|uniref:DsbA family protein n=2 Tax=Brevundimonas TaxID=41275 RepID=UPI0028A6912C